jgi:shikimate kinase
MPRITLVGYRGTGKSTVAAELGGLLGCEWTDADEVLESKVGCSISALVRSRGEPAFRDEEAAVLADLLERCGGVLSTGGGVVLRAENRALLRSAGRPIVWLTADAEAVHRRITADPASADRRPALADSAGRMATDPLAEVIAALAARESLYRECADATFDSTRETAAVVAKRIADWLEHAWPRLRDATPAGSPPPAGRSRGGGS